MEAVLRFNVSVLNVERYHSIPKPGRLGIMPIMKKIMVEPKNIPTWVNNSPILVLKQLGRVEETKYP